MYRIKANRLYKRLYIGLAAFGFLLIVSGFSMALKINDSSRAVVISPSIEIKTAPDKTSSTAFILHEGARVDVKDARGNWVEISFDDKRTGWIPKDDLGII